MQETCVYRFVCPDCKAGTFRKENRPWKCPRCKNKIQGTIFEYQKTFNIAKFAKNECPSFRISIPTIAMLDNMIKTIVLIQLDHCVKKARSKENPNKTILPEHFDWQLIEEFKLYLEWKYETNRTPENEEDI